MTADAEVTKAELDGGEFKFTPAADENGAGYASFTFKVSDRDGGERGNVHDDG